MVLRNKFKNMFRILMPGVLIAMPPNPIMVNNPFRRRFGELRQPEDTPTTSRSPASRKRLS